MCVLPFPLLRVSGVPGLLLRGLRRGHQHHGRLQGRRRAGRGAREAAARRHGPLPPDELSHRGQMRLPKDWSIVCRDRASCGDRSERSFCDHGHWGCMWCDPGPCSKAKDCQVTSVHVGDRARHDLKGESRLPASTRPQPHPPLLSGLRTFRLRPLPCGDGNLSLRHLRQADVCAVRRRPLGGVLDLPADHEAWVLPVVHPQAHRTLRPLPGEAAPCRRWRWWRRGDRGGRSRVGTPSDCVCERLCISS